MFRKFWEFLGFALIIANVLASCGPPPPVRITNITPDTEIPRKGGEITYEVTYENTSEEGFEDLRLSVESGEYLIFQSADPQPTNGASAESRQVIWQLGSLEAGQQGSVKVEYRLEREIPYEVYELEITARLQSLGADGQWTTMDSESATNMIQGHPTPTPLPTPTPVPTPLVERFKGYNGENVSMELPWQGYAVGFRQNEYFGPDPEDPSIYYDEEILGAEVDGNYDVITPIAYITVLDLSSSEVVNTFEPELKYVVDFSIDQIGVAFEDPGDIAILIFDHNKYIWIPYPTTVETLEEGRRWRATAYISEWTSHACYGRRRGGQ